MTAPATEFEASNVIRGDRRSAPRWVLSHVLRQRWQLFWLFSGAFTNAAFATVMAMGSSTRVSERASVWPCRM